MTTLANWQRELSTWGFFKVVVAHGPLREAALISARDRECEIVLTTYSTLRLNIDDFVRMASWDVVILDEAHTIKNEKSATSRAANMLPCRRRFALTGTPMSNDYKELWVLFDFVSKGRAGNAREFKNFYSRALGEGLAKNATRLQIRKRVQRQHQLKELMDMWMLQRFKSVLGGQLPKKDDNIIFCRLAPMQEEVYMRVLDSPDFQLLMRKDDPCHCGSGINTKDCHSTDPTGVLGQWQHPDGEPCDRCPSCFGLPAISQLLKLSNHLELIKPDDRRQPLPVTTSP